MLSRVADSIYWLCRYVERAESYARFVEANVNLTLDLPPGMAAQWRPLVDTTGDSGLFKDLYDDAFRREDVLRFLLLDARNPNSVLSCVEMAYANARTVRDVLSADIWLHINSMRLDMMEVLENESDLLTDPLPLTDQLHRDCLYFHALLDTTISHTEVWHFANLGRLLERADKSTRLLDVKYFILLPRAEDVGTSFDLLQWSSLLRSAGAYEMYTSSMGAVEPKTIASFIVLDDDFPRSIRFCLSRAEQSMRQITGSPDGTFANAAEKELSRFRADLDFSDIEELFEGGLHEYLDRLQKRLNRIGEALNATYFHIG